MAGVSTNSPVCVSTRHGQGPIGIRNILDIYKAAEHWNHLSILRAKSISIAKKILLDICLLIQVLPVKITHGDILWPRPACQDIYVA